WIRVSCHENGGHMARGHHARGCCRMARRQRALEHTQGSKHRNCRSLASRSWQIFSRVRGQDRCTKALGISGFFLTSRSTASAGKPSTERGNGRTKIQTGVKEVKE